MTSMNSGIHMRARARAACAAAIDTIHCHNQIWMAELFPKKQNVTILHYASSVHFVTILSSEARFGNF